MKKALATKRASAKGRDMADEIQDRMKKATDSLEVCRTRVEGFLKEYLDDRLGTLVAANESLGRELGNVVRNTVIDGGKRMRAGPRRNEQQTNNGR